MQVQPTVLYPTTPGLINWQQPWENTFHHLAPVTELSPDVLENKLSQLNVDGICKLLSKIDDLDVNAITKYKQVIKDNNINGRVLLHCDLNELKKLLNMNFGDWEMFRVLIVSLREHEMTSIVKQDESKNVRASVPKQQIAVQPRERKASAPKVTAGLSEKELAKLQGESKNKQCIIEKQITLEDQMICGALQTLNEEACEDVLEETEDVKRPEIEIPTTSVIPPSPDGIQGDSLQHFDFSMYKSCLSMKHVGSEKIIKKVAYVDEENPYIEPTIMVLEPKSINSGGSITDPTNSTVNTHA